MKNIPKIQVGIQFKPYIVFSLSGNYQLESGKALTGTWHVTFEKETIILKKDNETIKLMSGLRIRPENYKDCFFTLHNVTIGINFHWERNENQSFKGDLKLLIENDKITAINILAVEDYLMSVISSEMSATSSVELLKAHAVISRSWLLAQIEKNKDLNEKNAAYQSVYQTENELIKWYDREDHVNFDVCADDHCQRYQGITRSTTKSVAEAVKATSGEILSYNSAICDARYSKCCGGVVEVFENVWEAVNHPYLQKIIDNDIVPEDFSLDLESEPSAKKWILGNPDAFCNTSNASILKQVLNNYDQETSDFYRWEVKYNQKQISELIMKRTGIDFGAITDLIPIERGVSGRIIRLKIVGDKKTFTIGKELEIRKALSESHLYSSAFVVEKINESKQLVFKLHGAGWGHGVGLCQIGAAVMADKGYSYTEILKHYFKNINLEKRY